MLDPSARGAKTVQGERKKFQGEQLPPLPPYFPLLWL